MKNKVLIAVNSMAYGGIQKSLLAFLDELKEYAFIDILVWNDYYDIQLPSYVNNIDVPRVKSVRSVLANGGIRNKDFLVSIFGLMFKKRWKAMPKLKKEYDIAIDYSQVTDIKYFVIDNVKASKKYAFYHNGDYTFNDTIKKLDEEYYKKYDRVFAVSESCKEMLLDTFHHAFEIEVFPNYIPYQKILKMGEEACYEMSSYSGYKILSVGRLSEEKNPKSLIEMDLQLKKCGLNFRHYIIGDGPMRHVLEEKIIEEKMEDQVFLLGTQTNPYKYMKRCDLFVQLSRYEADPLTVKEAAIFGKKMILSDIEPFQSIYKLYPRIFFAQGNDDDYNQMVNQASPDVVGDIGIELNREHMAMFKIYFTS